MTPRRFRWPAPVLALLVLAAAHGAQVGETYEQVVAEKGKPPSQMKAGTVQVLSYPDSVIRLDGGVVVSIRPVAQPSAAPKPAAPKPAAAPAPRGPESAQVAEARAKISEAMAMASKIVNQPVDSVPITDGMAVTTFPEGWFHPGAAIPVFSAVDIQTTQETHNYERFAFITSNLNPGVAFAGKDCEFNPMTKFLYVDRTQPKKRLTWDEMQEVNRLYRIIGIYSAYLKRVGIAWSPTDTH